MTVAGHKRKQSPHVTLLEASGDLLGAARIRCAARPGSTFALGDQLCAEVLGLLVSGIVTPRERTVRPDGGNRQAKHSTGDTTVLGQRSEQNPHGTLLGIPNVYPMTVSMQYGDLLCLPIL